MPERLPERFNAIHHTTRARSEIEALRAHSTRQLEMPHSWRPECPLEPLRDPASLHEDPHFALRSPAASG